MGCVICTCELIWPVPKHLFEMKCAQLHSLKSKEVLALYIQVFADGIRKASRVESHHQCFPQAESKNALTLTNTRPTRLQGKTSLDPGSSSKTSQWLVAAPTQRFYATWRATVPTRSQLHKQPCICPFASAKKSVNCSMDRILVAARGLDWRIDWCRRSNTNFSLSLSTHSPRINHLQHFHCSSHDSGDSWKTPRVCWNAPRHSDSARGGWVTAPCTRSLVLKLRTDEIF